MGKKRSRNLEAGDAIEIKATESEREEGDGVGTGCREIEKRQRSRNEPECHKATESERYLVKVRISDLIAQTPEERRQWLAKVRAPRVPGEVTKLDLEIRELEQRYGMTTEEMKIAFRRGEVEDTPDIARWLILASLK